MNGRGTAEDGWGRFRSHPALRRARWAVPYGLILLGVVVNLVTPRGTTFAATFSAAPLTAAALWTFGGTLTVGAVSTSTMIALVVWWDRLPPFEAAVRLMSVFLVSLLALAINRALRGGDVRLESVREIAEAAQVAVLPSPPARVDGLSVAVRYEPAHAGAMVGGDLYAVQPTPYGVRMLVGDVAGKGLSAVDAVTIVLGAFREAADREPDLRATATWIERALRRESERLGATERAEEFVTAVVAEIPAGAPDRLRVISHGHPPPLLISPDGTVRAVEPVTYALPLGLGDLAPGPAARAREVTLPPGSLLLLHTDGVTEAHDRHGVMYDPVARLAGRRFTGPDDLLDSLVADVERWTGGLTADDMALLAVCRDGPGPGR